MYYIAVYDVNEKRVAKALKLFRRYLNWVQNSVFEGELTEGQMASLQAEVKKILDLKEDSIILYALYERGYSERKILGIEKNPTDNFI
jgi:CRISPR-associated protein Cas2